MDRHRELLYILGTSSQEPDVVILADMLKRQERVLQALGQAGYGIECHRL